MVPISHKLTDNYEKTIKQSKLQHNKIACIGGLKIWHQKNTYAKY